MYVYIYVCIYIYMYICIYICMYVCMYVCTVCMYTKVGRPLFWSAAQRTTEILADQRTGKISGPAPADYRN